MERSFLFTDIENSTSLWEVHPSDMLQALEWHDGTIGSLVANHEGELVKSTGDGVLAAFEQPGPAINCAVAIQRAMTTRVFGSVGSLRVRIGIHRGIAAPVGGDYLGSAVNRAARVMSAGAGGQTLASAEALTGVQLVGDISTSDLGHHRLRGVSESMSLFQLDAPGLEDDFPPPNTEPAVHNLRSYSSSFIGRQREMQQTMELLDGYRFVSLVGPGGCGKTRLATEVGRRTLDLRRSGTWFVDLAASASDGVLDAFLVGTEVHVREGQDPMAALQARFHGSDALVVVDNCEHVIDQARAVIEELLEVPGPRVLVTSRTSVGSAGEVVQRVAPLDVEPISIGDWSEAAELFTERSAQIGLARDALEDQRGEIEHLCRDLDGIPLALELAASRTRVLEVADLRQRLGQRLSLLKDASSSVVARHQTLRAAVEWSFSLLEPSSAEAMCWLAVFNGGFELDAAAALLGLDELDTIDLLDALVDQSLLQVDNEARPVRFSLLETMRQYGQEQLTDSGDLLRARAAHRKWMADLAASTERVHMTNDGPPAHDRLDREFPNLRSAMASALEDSPSDAAFLAADLGLYFWLRGHLSEGLRFCEQGLSACPDDDLGLQARLHLALGELSFGLLKLDESEVSLERAHHLALQAGDRATAGWASMFLATCHATTGRIEVAREHREFALEVANSDVSPSVRAGAYYYVGLVSSVLGESAVASEFLERSVVLAREAGSPYTLTRFLPVVARRAYSEGQEADAIELFGEALELAQRTHDPIGEVRCLVYLSEIELRRAHHSKVEEYLGAALPIVRSRIDDRVLATKVELGLAAMYRQMGRLPEAETHVALARQTARDLGSWRPSTDVDLAGALVAADLGDRTRATQGLTRSLAAAKEAQHDEWVFISTAHAIRLNIVLNGVSQDEAIDVLGNLSPKISRPEVLALGRQARGLGLLNRADVDRAQQELALVVDEYTRLGHRLATVEAMEELGRAQVAAGRSLDEYHDDLGRLLVQRRELGCPLSTPRTAWLRAPFQPDNASRSTVTQR